ncbi:hypothetical protein GCM10028895_26630 [Pontibacter rugosus]
MNAGLSFINNNGLNSSTPGATFKNKPAFVFPAQAGVYAGEKSRLRIELSNFKIKSELNYNYNTTQTGDPHMPSYAEVKIEVQAVNLNYDYQVLNRGSFDVYASAGLKSLFSTSKDEYTTYADGREEETAILISDFNRNLFGLGAGLVGRYNHTSKIGFTFVPAYSLYSESFNKNSSSKLNRLDLTLGVEYRL